MTDHNPADGWHAITNDPSWPKPRKDLCELFFEAVFRMTDEQLIEKAINDFVHDNLPSFYIAAVEGYVPDLAKHIAKVLKDKENHAA
jgi:hypothetical protein